MNDRYDEARVLPGMRMVLDSYLDGNVDKVIAAMTPDAEVYEMSAGVRLSLEELRRRDEHFFSLYTDIRPIFRTVLEGDSQAVEVEVHARRISDGQPTIARYCMFVEADGDKLRSMRMYLDRASFDGAGKTPDTAP